MRGAYHISKKTGQGVGKIVTTFIAPQFLALVLLWIIWWAAQLGLAGYLVYRVYQFVT